ncbi:MAG: rod shape-determining protein MreC [Clostridiales bacterium]|nr:rod shape-determining protein MreC [Clostridiales bacterium]
MKFFSSTGFKIMAAVLCAVLLGMAAAGLSGGDSYVGGLLSVVLSPFEKGAAYIAEFADDLSLNFRSASYYREQNEELESQLDELLRKTADYDDIKNRLEAYEIYTESGNDEFTKVYAQVTGRDSADVCSSMTLGVGTANGVSAGDPVITEEGVFVGIVRRAGVATCTVSTVLDPSVSIGTYDSYSLEAGFIDNGISQSFYGFAVNAGLSSDTLITPGSLILTSGAGGVVPKGLIIGAVSEVRESGEDVSLIAIVQPYAPLNNMKRAFVITDFPGKGEK